MIIVGSSLAKTNELQVVVLPRFPVFSKFPRFPVSPVLDVSVQVPVSGVDGSEEFSYEKVAEMVWFATMLLNV